MSSLLRFPLMLVIGILLVLSSCAKQDDGSSNVETSEQANIAIAEKMYETLIAGNMEGAFALMADGVTWTYYGGGGKIPFSGVYTGYKGIEQFFADFGAVATPLGMELQSFSASGETVFVTGIETTRINATGKEYAAPWVHVIKIKDGKIVSYEEHIDSALVAAAFE